LRYPSGKKVKESSALLDLLIYVRGGEMMLKRHWRKGWTPAVIILACSLVIGCAPKKITTGTFVQVNSLNSELRRGLSSKKDVERILGTPNGSGSAVLPTDPKLREVWYYDDIEMTDFRGEGNGMVRVNVRQQVLLVFFDREIFDGYMWFSNSGQATTGENDGSF